MKQSVICTWPSSISAVSAPSFGLHVADHVLLDEEAQVAVVQVLGQRRRQRQDVGGEVAHLRRHLQLGDGVADQRFVHVEVEEADLGVGDPPHRLHVDADQLQEGDQREAGGEHPGAVAQRRGVGRGEVALLSLRGAEDDEDPFDQLRLQPGLRGDRRDRDLAVGCSGNSSSVKPKASRPSRPALFRSSSE